jgi:hypothetical protein
VVGDVAGGAVKPRNSLCRVFWGTHGCDLQRGHTGPHLCSCAWDEDGDPLPYENEDEDGPWVNVGAPPYYGPNTRFFGDDAP